MLNKGELQLAALVRNQGYIITKVDLDTNFGCTTTRFIVYNEVKYIHIMHNGDVLLCKPV